MTVTKKIPELDPYGSVNKPAYLQDLIEISKNTGTYDDPEYDAGSSRRMPFEQLISSLAYVPYSGKNYEIVDNNGTAIENGDKLKIAAVACYSKLPNGSSLSTNNRAVIALLPGVYDLDSDTISISQFVDIVGIGNRNDIIITSTNANGTLSIANTNDYSLKSITIKNTGGGKSIYHAPTQTDNGKWYDIFCSNTIENTVFAGIYKNSYLGESLNGSISGYVENCEFANFACGSSFSGAVVISGTIKKCNAGSNSFGYSAVRAVTISGVIEDCNAAYNSFGYSEAAGYDITISGKISGCNKNITPLNFNFGATVSNSVNVIISGLIEDCDSTGNSFGYAPTASKVSISGKIKDCNDYALSSFGRTLAAGILENCTGKNSRGIHRGTIKGCTFINPDSSVIDVITLGNGARLQYSKIIQLQTATPKDAIAIDADAEVKITHCETNKDFNIVSGNSYVNLIAVGYNVIDSNLTQ